MIDPTPLIERCLQEGIDPGDVQVVIRCRTQAIADTLCMRRTEDVLFDTRPADVKPPADPRQNLVIIEVGEIDRLHSG